MKILRKCFVIFCVLAVLPTASISWGSRSSPEVDAAISDANRILAGLNYQEYEEATRRLLPLLQSAQSDAAYLACVSRSYSLRRMYSEAEDYLECAVKISGDNNPDVIEAKMVLAFEHGDKEEAARLSRWLDDDSEKRVNAIYYRARSVLYSNPSEAVDYLNIIMERTTDSARVLFYLYRAKVMLEEKTQAYRHYYQFLASSGGNPGIFRAAVGREILDGGYGERLQRIEGQLTIASRKAGLWQQKAETLQKLDEDLSLILDTYWQAYQASERENDYIKRRDIAYRLAEIYLEQDLVYHSLGCLKLALNADGFFIPAKTRLEKQLADVKNKEQARLSLLIDSATKLLINRKRLEKNYKKIPPPFRQGIIFLSEARPAQAVSYFEKSIKERSDFVPAYRYLIMSYLMRRLDDDMQGKIGRDVLANKAKKLCDDLEMLEPANIYVQYFRGVIANDEQEYAEAMLYLKISANRYAELADVYFEMVYTYRKLGLYMQAEVVSSGLLAATPANKQKLNRVMFSR
jgi:tetratricopeptide (TPR) repeat protein